MYAKLIRRYQSESGEKFIATILQSHGKVIKILEERKWATCVRLVNEKYIAASKLSGSGHSTGANDQRCFTIDVVDTVTSTFEGRNHPFHRRNSAPECRHDIEYVISPFETCSASKDDTFVARNSSEKLCPYHQAYIMFPMGAVNTAL